MFGRDARPPVRERNIHMVFRVAQGNGDLRVRGMFDGIIKQVLEYFCQADSISLDRGSRFEVQFDIERFIVPAGMQRDVAKQGIQADGLKIHRHHPALQAGRIEQPVNQHHQVISLFINDGKKFLLSGRFPGCIRAQQRGGIAFDEANGST